MGVKTALQHRNPSPGILIFKKKTLMSKFIENRHRALPPFLANTIILAPSHHSEKKIWNRA